MSRPVATSLNRINASRALAKKGISTEIFVWAGVEDGVPVMMRTAGVWMTSIVSASRVKLDYSAAVDLAIRKEYL